MNIGSIVEVASTTTDKPYAFQGVVTRVFDASGQYLVEVLSSNQPHLHPGMYATVCATDIVMELF